MINQQRSCVIFIAENSEDFLFDWKTIISYGINPFRDWIFIEIKTKYTLTENSEYFLKYNKSIYWIVPLGTIYLLKNKKQP